MALFPFSDLIEHGDKVWFSVYSDLLGFEFAGLTGYVECFKSDNGFYKWEILGESGDKLYKTSGYGNSVQSAQEYVEHTIGAR